VNRRSPFLSEDIGSALKGGEKLCQRRLVNELLLVTKFALNLSCKGATFIQRDFDSGLFDRIWVLKLTRHCTLPNISKPPHSVSRSFSAPGSIYLLGAALAAGL
jgi:hypothetical protein